MSEGRQWDASGTQKGLKKDLKRTRFGLPRDSLSNPSDSINPVRTRRSSSTPSAVSLFHADYWLLPMITALTGQLQELTEDPAAAHLQAGHMVFEILVPAADVESLRAQVGAEITFHTIFYLEGSAGGGNLDPKLIGFQSADDKRFFELFTTVKGIGPKTALRALSVPAGEIAQAIESKDTKALTQLDGIGKRTAELIVAELSGKVKDFATAHAGALVGAHAGGGNGAHAHLRRSPAEEDAILAMTTLGERRTDAERLLERVKQLHPEMKGTDALLREMLRVRGGR